MKGRGSAREVTERTGTLRRRVRISPSVLSFLGRFAIACVVVAGVAAAGVYSGDTAARRAFLGSDKINVPGLEKAEPGKPANYLLIGSDTRALGDDPGAAQAFGTEAEVGGARSDVMMVLHVEPATQTGMLVSFPRDLVVQIPDHGEGLLNSSFSIGGPALVIRTLEENFLPLKINHYIQVDFKGFQDIVNAIGKIPVFFPTQVHDEFTGLHIDKPGCVRLDGGQALAYARSRHYNIPRDPDNIQPWVPRGESKRSEGWFEDPRADLDRIPRQQYFLRTISQAAIDKTAANPTKLFGLFDAVQDNFTRDDTLTLKEMKALIRTFKGLNPARVDMQTLPVEAGKGKWAAQVVATDEASSVIGRLSYFGQETPPTPDLIPTNEVNVLVINGSGVPGVAGEASDAFRAAGFNVVGPAQDADRDDYSRTQVRYAPDKFAAGVTAANALGTINVVEAISRRNTLDADVLVIIGKDYEYLGRPFMNTNTSTSAPGVTATTTTTVTTVPQTSTTPTTTPQSNVDTRFVPVDPKTGGPLVGCPS